MIEPLKNPNEYRGYFITQFAKLERSIDVYLAEYFLLNNINGVNEIIEVLIDRITFESKRTALKVLLDKKHASNTDPKKRGNPYKKLLDELRKTAEVRNWFAHYHLVVTNHDKNLVIGLLQFRDSTNIKSYTHAQFEKLIDDIEISRQVIIKLIETNREAGLGL